MDNGDSERHGAIAESLHFKRSLWRMEIGEIGAMRGEQNIVHRKEFKLLAGLVGDAQHVRRQSEWAVQVSHEKSDVARAALKADLRRFSRHCGKSTLDAIILEFRINGNDTE